MDSILRKCNKCYISKNVYTEFHKNPNSRYGRTYTCKACLKGTSKRKKTIKRICTECKKDFLANKTLINEGYGFTCSRTCMSLRLKRVVARDEKHVAWKGDEAGYQALHTWVEVRLGKPKLCDFCKITDARLYDWSNISGEYKRDLSDWQRLCRKCHMNYDGNSKKAKVTLHKRYGTIDTRIASKIIKERNENSSLIKS